MKATWKEPGFAQADTHPVVGLTHFEALDFCSWLTAHERAAGRLGAQDRYRLPTNAEWSVAAGLKADAQFPSGHYPWGAAFPPTAPAANYASEDLRGGDERYARFAALDGYRDGHAFTAPVGSYPADARGLHDLGGNVWEWTDDDDEPRPILRGGSWGDARADKLDLATRIAHDRGVRCYTFGFRLVLDRKEQGRPRPE
jgi:formylglycine-generating enzyme required for sulfatase activity